MECFHWTICVEVFRNVCLSYESSLYEEWTAGVSEACSFNLKQPLLTRNKETNLIAVNFDPQVYVHSIYLLYYVQLILYSIMYS